MRVCEAVVTVAVSVWKVIVRVADSLLVTGIVVDSLLGCVPKGVAVCTLI